MARRLPKVGTVRVGTVSDPPGGYRHVTYLRPKGLGGMFLAPDEGQDVPLHNWVRLTFQAWAWKCEDLGPTIDEDRMRLDLFGHDKYGERPG